MSGFLAFPPVREVRGTVLVPPSKSATNRALVLAALSQTSVEIVRPLESEDTQALAQCLARMGASLGRSGAGLFVSGPLGRLSQSEVLLDAGESGTAARFLAAVAAAVPGRYLLTGSARLLERPIGELVSALRSGGAQIEFRGGEGCLPLSILGGTLRPGRIAVDASRSSQFLSALLLAGAALGEGLEVRATGSVASSPYIALTVEQIRAFGHQITEGAWLRVSRGHRAVARYEVPGDFSSALPLLASAGIAGGQVTAQGLDWPVPDADALAIPLLEKMGLQIAAGEDGVTASARAGRLRPVVGRATDFPDAVPTLAAVAAFAPGTSRFEGIGHLRLKESDRIESLAALLLRAGVEAAAGEDSLIVRGPLRPAAPAEGVRRLATAGDHRIAMAAALLSLRVPGLLIENPACVAKSYPGFFRDLDSLALR